MRVIKYLRTSGQLVALATLLFVFLPTYAEAETVLQTEQPLQTQPLFQSNLSSPNEILVQITTNDTINLALFSQETNNRYFFYVKNDVNGDTFPCNQTYVNSCVDDDVFVQYIAGGSSMSGTNLGNSTYSYNLGSSYTFATSTYYLVVAFDPNPPTQTGKSFNGNTLNSNVYTLSYNNFIGSQPKLNFTPSIILCNNSCDSNAFSPLPTLTATPWVNLTSPFYGAVIPYTQTFSYQVNTGTTSADNLYLQFTSNNQSFLPVTLPLNSTGLNQLSYQQVFPQIDDTVNVTATLRASTTPLASTTGKFFVQIGTDSTLPLQVESCDGESNLSWAICKVAVLLFAPSNDSIDRFTSINTQLETKFPFVYVYQGAEMFDDIFNTEGTASSSMTIQLWGQPFTLISASMVEAFPLQDELRYLIGTAISILTALWLYRRTLKIFNPNPV